MLDMMHQIPLGPECFPLWDYVIDIFAQKLCLIWGNILNVKYVINKL